MQLLNCSRLWTDGTPSLIKVTTAIMFQISRQTQRHSGALIPYDISR